MSLVSYDVFIPELNLPIRAWGDPLILSLLKLFAFSASPEAYLLGQIIILAVGFYCSARVSGLDRSTSLVSSAASSVLFIHLTGNFPSYIKLYWCPALVAALLKYDRKGGAVRGALALGVGCLWALTAGSLSVLGLLAILITVKLSSEPQEQSPVGFSLVAMLILGTSIYLMPEFRLENFPPGARLNEISPLTFSVAPLTGSELSPNPISYAGYLELLKFSLVRFTPLLMALAFLVFRGAVALRWLVGVITIFLVSYLELYPRFTTAGWPPFQFLRRVIPGVGLTPLPGVLLALGGVLILSLLPRALARSACARNSILFALIIAVVWENVLCFATKNGELYRRSSAYEVHSVVNANKAPREELPFRYLLSQTGNWARGVENFAGRRDDALEQIKINSNSVNVRATVSPELAQLAIDGDLHTRWATAKPQVGGEEFELSFASPVSGLLRIELNIRESRADYPRGIRVTGVMESGERKVLSELNPWNGRLQWTRDGEPYFGDQSDVVIDLPSEITVKRLIFTQLATSEREDWSVYEVLLFRRRSL